jgi:hypothetical protein
MIEGSSTRMELGVSVVGYDFRVENPSFPTLHWQVYHCPHEESSSSSCVSIWSHTAFGHVIKHAHASCPAVLLIVLKNLEEIHRMKTKQNIIHVQP